MILDFKWWCLSDHSLGVILDLRRWCLSALWWRWVTELSTSQVCICWVSSLGPVWNHITTSSLHSLFILTRRWAVDLIDSSLSSSLNYVSHHHVDSGDLLPDWECTYEQSVVMETNEDVKWCDAHGCGWMEDHLYWLAWMIVNWVLGHSIM